MDNTEIHYLTYDPNEIMTNMLTAYIEAGGDILYPGDEKEMLLRAVLAVITQMFAGVDNALRMATLRYATGAYLDIYGEARNCARLPAQAATCVIAMTVMPNASLTIPAGTVFTADGKVLYVTDDDAVFSNQMRTISVQATCFTTGTDGNSLTLGTYVQPIHALPALVSAVCAKAASGGMNEEDDESYRVRIREHGLNTVTTGPAAMYEAAAMAVSSSIIDASAVQTGAGEVTVYLITDDNDPAAIAERVSTALSAETARPLTDHVIVAEAEAVDYTIVVNYTVGQQASSDVTGAIQAAASAYKAWQDNHIGEAFNPDRLMSALYSAGAERVVWGEGSEFDGGDIAYTAIGKGQRCKGTITLVQVTEV